MDLLFLEVDEQLHSYHRNLTDFFGVEAPWLRRRFIASWIYHDLSLEGAIFRDDELKRGLDGRLGANWSENRLLEKVRNVERTIQQIYEHARRQGPFDLEFIKSIHRWLRDDDDESAGRYRKDAGPSSAYRHDISPPTGISYRFRKLVGWTELEGALLHPIATASEIHKQLIEIFPFQRDNGLVARFAMNAWLLRNDYPPAVIHSHDRHEYWAAYLSTSRFRKLVVKSILQAADAELSGRYPDVSTAPALL